MTSYDAFFRRDGDRFVGNDAARGPWYEHTRHAGTTPLTPLALPLS